MEKIKEILRRKINFILRHGGAGNLLDFIEFAFSTLELTEIMRKLVMSHKIPREVLQNWFNAYIAGTVFVSENGDVGMPNFYDADVERKFGLLKSMKQLAEEELANAKLLNVEEVGAGAKLYTYEDLNAIQKLYLDIIQEIDLLSIRKGSVVLSEKGFQFDEKRGILKFCGEEIGLSAKGGQTDAVLLLKTLCKEETDAWKYNDDILKDWGYYFDDLKGLPKNKIYAAGLKINNAVALKTKVVDFIDCTTSKARINPKYRAFGG